MSLFWACLKGITQSKTLKEEYNDKKYLYDNYNLVYSDTIYYNFIFQD